MTKRLALLVVLMGGMVCNAQWYNAWSEKAGLALSLRLDGGRASLYSPMQTQAPLPVSSCVRSGDTLRLECKSIGFKTELVCGDSVLEGWWRQGVLREKISFRRADTIFMLRRPQDSLWCTGFSERDVETDYTDSQGNAVHLEGTLCLPDGGGAFPCLLLVSGSGQQNRDEELLFHRPFRVLAHYLASRGVASLRYDDRGVGGSTGPLDSADTRLFSEDAEAMFGAMLRCRGVDPGRAGICGHSEGGAIAPMVAARNEAVKAVVMLAGQGCTGREVLVQQNGALLAAMGVGDPLRLVRERCIDDVIALPDGAGLKDYQAVIARHLSGLDDAQRDSLRLKKADAYMLRTQMQNPWMQSFLRLDPADWLPGVRCPVLALWGGLDRQVVATENMRRVRQLAPRADCRVLPGLNHLFQHCTTGSAQEYALIEETMAEEAMQAVAVFMLGL
ncbi:MAG: alpha/beta hydrolase [Bacteroidales bacterium]|nr:alpha/beta hydrolase [Bacteroidales bacterium]